MAAVEGTGIPRKAYFTAFRRSMFERFRAVLAEQGADVSQFPQPDPEPPDDGRGRSADHDRDPRRALCRTKAPRAGHPRQPDGRVVLGRAPTEVFGVLFGEESFIRALDTTGAPLPETDLFVGFPT